MQTKTLKFRTQDHMNNSVVTMKMLSKTKQTNIQDQSFGKNEAHMVDPGSSKTNNGIADVY